MSYATILVNLEAGHPNTHLLRATEIVAERFQATVIGSTACNPIQISYSDGYIPGEIFEQDSASIATEIAEAEAEFRHALGGRGLKLAWRSAVVVTPLADNLAQLARGADLVLTAARPEGTPNVARQVVVGDMVMQIGRPVLLVSPSPQPFGLDSVLVAWKDTREARRAVADALPLLKQAKQISLVEVTSSREMAAARLSLDDVAEWLERHGITADRKVRLSAGDETEALQTVMNELDADLVVAGAYGHSRVREWALGGVTRTLLQYSERSSLVSH